MIPLRSIEKLSIYQTVAIAADSFSLASVLPVASTARSGGKSTLWLTNLHILGQAWTAYQEDNMDGWWAFPIIPPPPPPPPSKGSPYHWVEVPLYTPVYGSTPVDATECNLTYQLNGVRAGKLFAYTQNEQVYHCPNDKYWLTKAYVPGSAMPDPA